MQEVALYGGNYAVCPCLGRGSEACNALMLGIPILLSVSSFSLVNVLFTFTCWTCTDDKMMQNVYADWFSVIHF